MTDIKEDYYFSFLPDFEKNNKHIDWAAYHATMNIALTFTVLDNQIARFLAPWDLFPSAYNLLNILYRTEGKGLPLSRISELLAVSRANVTGLVDVLNNKGLVERTHSKQDRRIRLACLTPKGVRLVKEITPQYYSMLSGICSCLTEEQQNQLFTSLSMLRTQISNRKEKEKEKELDLVI